MTAFAHETERYFADLLDFYEVEWEYEPVEFALSWSVGGLVTTAFRPDFYLPEHCLYVELTTLRQDLVTAKNRKIRRLRQLHPEIRLKVLYRRDVEELLLKYPWSCPVGLAG